MSWDIKALGLGFRLQLYEVYRVMLLLLSGFDIELCSQAGFSWLGALNVNHENWFCKDFLELSSRTCLLDGKESSTQTMGKSLQNKQRNP